jgi:hypothetical protein
MIAKQLKFVLVAFSLVVLVGCAPQPVVQTPAVAPTSVQSTPVPPTQEPTAIPPTNAPAVTPTTQIGPETQVYKIEDIVGIWELKLVDNAGTANFEIRADGTYTIVGVSGDAAGATLSDATLRFEDGQLILEINSDCIIDLQGNQAPCVGIYQAYIAKQGDKPAYLKLSVVDDPAFDRKKTLNNKKLPIVQQ